MLNAKHLRLLPIAAVAFVVGAPAGALACHPGGPKHPWGGYPVQHEGMPDFSHSHAGAVNAWFAQAEPCKGYSHFAATTEWKKLVRPEGPPKIQIGKTTKTIGPQQVPAGALQTKDIGLAKKPSAQVDPHNPNAPADKQLRAGAHELGTSGVCFPPSRCAGPALMQNPGSGPGLPGTLDPGAGRAGPVPRN
jgi:hypothetical protein